MTTATPEKAEGLKALQTACDEIQKTITEFNGVFQIKMAVCRFPCKIGGKYPHVINLKFWFSAQSCHCY